MNALQQAPQQTFFRPRFDGPNDGGPRHRFPRYPHHYSAGRFRPPGYSGQINDNRGPRSWVEHRPGYTPNTTYNQGKQAKKSSHRKTIDYNSNVLRALQNRLYLRDGDETHAIFPDSLYMGEMTTPSDMRHNPINCVTTKFIRQSTNKIKCPIFTVAWTPEGRRLVTGASSGEFTLWNGLTFNFETILQAHDSSVRSMVWSHDDHWMMTGDHNGFVKYWQSNMNNVKMFQAHKEAIRGLSFCPTDAKFASCSDDGSVRIFDFATCTEEKLLKGHGADMRCVDWHPHKSILISGSKDSQQPIKLWDARTGMSLATIHAHKSTVMSMKWNRNGNWFLTASRDHLLKLFDIRNMKTDFQTFKGHQKEATVVSWHPIYEDFFASGGSDGAIKFWSVGTDKEVGSNDTAHEGFIWSMAWHPMGHILVTGSNDHSTKFWARNKPGDTMKDRYNLNLLPAEDEMEENTVNSSLTSTANTELPGMGIDEETIEQIKQAHKDGIPGLDMDGKDMTSEVFLQERKGKYMFTKKIDRSFAAAWEGKVTLPPQNYNAGRTLLGERPSIAHPPPKAGLLDPPPQNEDSKDWRENQNTSPSFKPWELPTGGLIQPPIPAPDFNSSGPTGMQGPNLEYKRPDFAYGPRQEFRGMRPDFHGRPRNDFRGPGSHKGPRNEFRGPRPDSLNGPRNDFRQPRPDFNGFRPPSQNNFNGPRLDFRGPRPNYRPRGSQPSNQVNRNSQDRRSNQSGDSGNDGKWRNQQNWNGPRKDSDKPAPY